jgi:lipid-A-disaccharide synthase
MPLKILISAGEASGDLYAANLAAALRRRMPDVDLFGCTGPRMQAAGVRTVVDASSLAVVGVFEVVSHIPRIYGEYRKLVRAARDERPDLAILTDSPDFHLRLARRLKRMGVPVIYLVAPQVWAWRKGRLPKMRRVIDRLLCIFPFEEAFFREHGIAATYIGHPLATLVRPSLTRQEFCAKRGLATDRPLVALLPGSRHGEAARHMPALADAAQRIARVLHVTFVLARPAGRFIGVGEQEFTDFKERIPGSTIQVIAGDTWNVLAHADVALAASGTVTVEAAVLATPMVTFYKVTPLSWLLGKLLVDVPFYSMVNLVAGRAVVPELMQNEMSGGRLATEALRLLNDPAARGEMRRDLQEVARELAGVDDPIERAAGIVDEFLATGDRRQPSNRM